MPITSGSSNLTAAQPAVANPIIRINDLDNWSYDASAAELLELYIQGKDLIKDKNEYLEIIMRLPYVNKDNLIALEVYERLRFLHDTITTRRKK